MCQELNIKTIKDYNRLKNSLNKDLKECNWFDLCVIYLKENQPKKKW
jgi:hypothetical protein